MNILGLDRTLRLLYNPIDHSVEKLIAQLLTAHIYDYALSHFWRKVLSSRYRLSDDLLYESVAPLCGLNIVVLNVDGEVQALACIVRTHTVPRSIPDSLTIQVGRLGFETEPGKARRRIRLSFLPTRPGRWLGVDGPPFGIIGTCGIRGPFDVSAPILQRTTRRFRRL